MERRLRKVMIGRFKGIFWVALIVASLMTSALLILSASPAPAHPSPYEVIVWAKEDSITTGSFENTIWGWDNIIYVGRYLDGPARGWLKLDLRAIPSLENMAKANLRLHCSSVSGMGAAVRCHRVDNDDWSENTINWTNMPQIGDVLDTRAVLEGGRWYSYDVTDFVREQFALDNLASFCLVDLGENIATDRTAYFTSKEHDNENLWPFLEIENQLAQRDVRVYVDPVFQGGLSGWSENFRITVVNKGTSADTYTLENADNLGWVLNLDNTSLSVPAGENRKTTLRVQVPSGSPTLNHITINATGTGVSDSASCYAHRGRAPSFAIQALGIPSPATLYKIEVDTNFLVGDGSGGLVLKFYKYWDVYQGENAIVSSVPWLVKNPMYVHHPIPSPPIWEPVAKVRLVLVDTAGGEILEIGSFTANRVRLWGRLGGIRKDWGYATPSGKTALWAELGKLCLQWQYTM